MFLDVPDEILVERVVGRRTDPARGKKYHMTFFSPPEDEEVIQRLEQRSDDAEEKN
jgi:adenylate kinase